MANSGLHNTRRVAFSEVTNGVFLWAAGNRPLLNKIERDNGVWELAIKNKVGNGKPFWFGGVDYRVGFCYHRLDKDKKTDNSRSDGILTNGADFLHLGSLNADRVEVQV